VFLFGKAKEQELKRQRKRAEARQLIADARMRRALFRLMWEESEKGAKHPRPCPTLNDEQIEAELRRILGG